MVKCAWGMKVELNTIIMKFISLNGFVSLRFLFGWLVCFVLIQRKYI